MPNLRTYYTRAELKQHLKLDKTEVSRMRNSGLVKPRKFGQFIVYLGKEIEEYLASLPPCYLPSPNKKVRNSSTESKSA